MQSKAKTNTIITTGYDETTGEWTFNVATVGELRLARSAMASAIFERGMIEGISDRIVDKAALPFNKEEKRFATPREKYDAMAGLIAHYATGTSDWSIRAAGDGSGGRSLTIEGIARVKGCDYAKAEAMVVTHADTVCGGDRKQALVELRKSPKVKAAMAAIRDERQTTDLAADDLIDNLPE